MDEVLGREARVLRQGGQESACVLPIGEERRTFTTELVEIHGVGGRILQGSTSTSKRIEVRNADGEIGRCLGWDETLKKYIVQTTEGTSVAVDAENLRDFRPLPAESGGFDLMWPSDASAHKVFANDLAECLRQKGYCLVQMFMNGPERDDAMGHAGGLEDFEEFREGLESCYMGRDSNTKAAKMEHDTPQKVVDNSLLQCDRLMTIAGMLLTPLAPSYFGFEPTGRTNAYVRLPYVSRTEKVRMEASPIEEADVHAGMVENFLDFMHTRKIAMLYLIDGDDRGHVSLLPTDGTNVRIPFRKGRMLIFRNDLMQFSYQPQGQSLALQSWMMADVAHPPQLIEVHGKPAPQGLNISITTGHTEFSGNAFELSRFWSMTLAGTDCLLLWPFNRFDLDAYYASENAVMQGKSYACHVGCLSLEEFHMFDNEKFGIPAHEALSMTPNQRIWLEVGYACMYKAGFTPETSKNRKIGVFLGDVGADWHTYDVFISNSFHYSGCQGLSTNTAVSAGRLSYFMGLVGPTQSFDTACSSSLFATHHGAVQLMKSAEGGGCGDFVESGLVGGINTTGPVGYVANSGGNMLSHVGRCFTFDQTADGYIRGEGGAGFFMKVTTDLEEIDSRLGVIAGVCANHNGKAASLTAPSGPGQQKVLRFSMQMAGIVPNDVTLTECHGTGTSLGDPIEVGAILAVFSDTREKPLPHTTGKTNMSHMEGCAGIGNLLRCLNCLLHGSTLPNVNLRAMSPHLEQQGFPSQFVSELVDNGDDNCAGYGGATSMGFAGANARVELHGACKKGPRTGVAVDKIKRRELQWEQVRAELMSNRYDCEGFEGLFKVKEPIEGITTSVFKSLNSTDVTFFENEQVVIYEYSGDGRMALVEDLHERVGWVPAFLVQPRPYPRDPASVSIRGTFNNFTDLELMDNVQDDVWICGIRLGDTKMEEFQLVLNEDINLLIHPHAKDATQKARIMGPDLTAAGKERAWVINGYQDDVPAGTVYKITFRPGQPHQISWQPVTEGIPEFVFGEHFVHTYWVSGSWRYHEMQEMARSYKKDGLHEVSFTIGRNGFEEFNVLRDCSSRQVIYPAEHRAENTSIPVMGPNACGENKLWLVRGKPGEEVQIKLFVNDGEISVEVAVGSLPIRVFESPAYRPREIYHVAGTFTEWRPVPMDYTHEEPGIFRQVIIMSDVVEEFQIVIEGDWGKTLYPMTSQYSATAIMKGPDGQGHGQNWHIYGMLGDRIIITLDTTIPDRRRSVSWERQGAQEALMM